MGLALLMPLTAANAGDMRRFGLPIACDLGQTCFVQQYADRDPTAGIKDYACGVQTYDGHDGIDIRVRDTSVTADVIAAADGVVKAVRDGVADRLMLTPEDRQEVRNRECGNGVVIAHGGSWETQYCHLRNGSASVKVGERVTAGTRLGHAGYSGMAAFPHVHLTIRHKGKAVDPFRPADHPQACGAGSDHLWTDDALASLAYAKGSLLRAGFAPKRVEIGEVETGTLADAPLAADWPALVAYGWAINLEQGDLIRVSLGGPEGFSAENEVTLDRAKAQYLLFAGKKRPPGGWPKGLYRGLIEVRRGGDLKLSRSWGQWLD